MEHGVLEVLVDEESPAASVKMAGLTLAVPPLASLTVASLIVACLTCPLPDAVSLTVVYLTAVPLPIFGFCSGQSMLSWCPPALGQRQLSHAQLCAHVVQPRCPAYRTPLLAWQQQLDVRDCVRWGTDRQLAPGAAEFV